MNITHIRNRRIILLAMKLKKGFTNGLAILCALKNCSGCVSMFCEKTVRINLGKKIVCPVVYRSSIYDVGHGAVDRKTTKKATCY